MLPRTFLCKWGTKIGCVVIGYVTGGLSIALCVGSVIRLFFGLPIVLQDDELQGQFPFNPLYFIFTAAYFAMHTVTSFGLVPAVKEEQGLFIIPSIIMLPVDAALSCIGVIVLGVLLEKQKELHKFLVGGIIVGSTTSPILIYFTLIVVSEFEEVFERSDHKLFVLRKKLNSDSHNKRNYKKEHSTAAKCHGTIV
ncbi:uncharacterized protein [Parasteatoda tepidariorum]|uniref:uncharacterized protein isoform X1 n=1 Tax=Parasteatoda tepidariorum TaxID=114398 RepID=UPI00077FCFA2|nr:uncharacterized protein LOC107438614 isoform X1 [Parasteatoda tepidariorum]